MVPLPSTPRHQQGRLSGADITRKGKRSICPTGSTASVRSRHFIRLHNLLLGKTDDTYSRSLKGPLFHKYLGIHATGQRTVLLLSDKSLGPKTHEGAVQYVDSAAARRWGGMRESALMQSTVHRVQ